VIGGIIVDKTKIHIETPHLIIRNFLPSDAKDVSYYSQQPKVAYWLSDMILDSESEALSWINWINGRYNLEDPNIVLAIELKEKKICIGVVGVAPKAEINNEIEILFAVSDEYQGRGYATEGAKALIDWVFKNINIESISAIVKPENIASKKVIENLGYQYIDTQVLPYDGQMCSFNYYKLTHR